VFAYAVRRTIGSVPTLFALTAITFIMMRIAPGGPFSGNRRITQDALANIERAYHLDEPLWLQFGPLRLGRAAFRFRPVDDVSRLHRERAHPRGLSDVARSGHVGDAAGHALTGIALGIAGALRRNQPVDYIAGALAMTGLAIPDLRHRAPSCSSSSACTWAGCRSPTGPATSRTRSCPVITLALPNIAYVSRLMRGSMIETVRTNYVRTARAKGIGEWRHHRPSRLQGRHPAGGRLSRPGHGRHHHGSIVVEQIFQIPGIGRYFVTGANNRDYPLMLGVTLFYGAIVIFANLLTDLGRGLIDPKVSYE
jgi:oligopeptide transport system permease protein